ncbi:MAG: Ig-like domain-containing protein, partial [Planctomycetia bacterium]|nr:Ig-like domain-containing protein [Planctomycetia bacterium]
MRTLASLAFVMILASVAAAQSLTAFPAKLAIRGTDDAPQLLVTAKTSTRELDATAKAKYAVANASICRVDETGRVFPNANGSTTITATVDGQSVTVPVGVSGMEAPRPINFANQIEPILTKLACNSGGCHGKIQGQNGFRLSLLGFDPELDYMTLLKESRGRRLMPASPDASLFLTKATGKVPHGGGKKLEPNGEEYKVLRRWIAAGMPYGEPTDPTITKVVVHPESRVIDRQGRQQ